MMLARVEHRGGGKPTCVYLNILIFSDVFVDGFEDTLLGDLEVLVTALQEGDISVDNISK